MTSAAMLRFVDALTTARLRRRYFLCVLDQKWLQTPMTHKNGIHSAPLVKSIGPHTAQLTTRLSRGISRGYCRDGEETGKRGKRRKGNRRRR